MKNIEKNTGKINVFEDIYRNHPDPWKIEEHYILGLSRVTSTLKHIPESSYSNILDLGCCKGYSTDLLSNFGEKIVGVDIAPTAVRKAKIRLNNKTNCEFVAGDIQKLPFKHSSFDLIACIEVLSYLAKSPNLENIITDLKSLERERNYHFLNTC